MLRWSIAWLRKSNVLLLVMGNFVVMSGVNFSPFPTGDKIAITAVLVLNSLVLLIMTWELKLRGGLEPPGKE